jgi:tRNA(fMet)-specific endonuclease VapC
VVDIDLPIARRFGEVFATLRRAGTPLPLNDIWIASITLELGAHLVTFDSDYARVDGLSCTLMNA